MHSSPFAAGRKKKCDPPRYIILYPSFAVNKIHARAFRILFIVLLRRDKEEKGRKELKIKLLFFFCMDELLSRSPGVRRR